MTYYATSRQGVESWGPSTSSTGVAEPVKTLLQHWDSVTLSRHKTNLNYYSVTWTTTPPVTEEDVKRLHRAKCEAQAAADEADRAYRVAAKALGKS